MTVDTTIIFPQPGERVFSPGNSLELQTYHQELIFTLERMYERLAQGINGNIRASILGADEQWTPIVRDSANSGTTFTYSHQVGWVFRQGIFVDCWFDVQWTANTGAITGNMYVELPYLVAITDEKPFVGVVQPSGFTFTGGTACVVNGIDNSYRAEIWNTGDAFTTANPGS